MLRIVRVVATVFVVGLTAGASAALAAPPKYQVVVDGPVSAPAGGQGHASADCPTGTVTYGGGVSIATASINAANIQGSWPQTDGSSWNSWVANGNGVPVSFSVYAICAKKTAKWSVQVTSEPFPANSVTGPLVAPCPAGTKVLGGGSFSPLGVLGDTVDASFPVKTGSGSSATYSWQTFMNNATGFGTTEDSFAVCGSAKGYAFIHGKSVDNPTGAQDGGEADCKTPKVPLGGGVSETETALGTNVGTSAPNSNPAALGWFAAVNNTSPYFQDFRVWVICAS